MNTNEQTPKPRSRQTIRRLRAIYRMYADRYLDALIQYYGGPAETNERGLEVQSRLDDATGTIATEIAVWINYLHNPSVPDLLRARARNMAGDGARMEYLLRVADDIERRIQDPNGMKNIDIPMPA